MCLLSRLDSIRRVCTVLLQQSNHQVAVPLLDRSVFSTRGRILTRGELAADIGSYRQSDISDSEGQVMPEMYFRGRGNMISWDKYRRKLVLLGFLLLVGCLPPVRSDQFDLLNASSSLNVTSLLLSKPSKHFELGIFPYGEDKHYYLCIRYSLPVEQVVTFVANRDRPVSNLAVLQFVDGKLQLSDPTNANIPIAWTAPASGGIKAENAILNDTGNLLLLNGSGAVIWDSFNNHSPTDTLLPGQYMYRNRSQYLTSWQKDGSPPTYGTGSYTFGWSGKVPTLSLSWTAPDTIKWTGGPYIPAPDVHNARKIEGVDYVYFHGTLGHLYINSVPADTSILSGGSDDVNATTFKRITISDDGGLRIYQWTNASNSTWTPKANWVLSERPDTRSQCTAYGTCGPYGVCISPVDSLLPVQCKCLDGFNVVKDTDLARGCIFPTTTPPISATMHCTDNSSINANFTTDTTNLGTMLTLEETDMPWGGDYLILTGNASANCKEACMLNCWCSGAVYSEDEKKCWMGTGKLYNIGYPTLALHGTKRTAFIRSVEVTVYPFPLPTKKKPWAKIVGLVVAGGAGVAVIVGSIWYLSSRGLLREAYQCWGLCRARPTPPHSPPRIPDSYSGSE